MIRWLTPLVLILVVGCAKAPKPFMDITKLMGQPPDVVHDVVHEALGEPSSVRQGQFFGKPGVMEIYGEPPRAIWVTYRAGQATTIEVAFPNSFCSERVKDPRRALAYVGLLWHGTAEQEREEDGHKWIWEGHWRIPSVTFSRFHRPERGGAVSKLVASSE